MAILMVHDAPGGTQEQVGFPGEPKVFPLHNFVK